MKSPAMAVDLSYLGRREFMSAGPSSIKGAIRIMTVDDHPLLRQGIAALINTQPDMEMVAEACDGEEAIAQFRAHRPDVTLMDIQMPNVDSTEAISRIRSEFPEAKIIVLSTYAGDVQILRAIKAGARGYLLKGNVRTELLEAIRTVHAGRKRIPPEIAVELADHAADDQLSAREIDVLRLIGEGNANKQIADKLSIAETTVKNHISNSLSKLGANDRAHAVTIALQRGIIELDIRQR
jgi:DNA-binding NarL/FixJ family response regulator